MKGSAIISVSRRTDIPAFYPQWFMNRVREGFADVPNPFNPRQVRRVSLQPAEVTAFVFWTKNPAPMLSDLEELDERGYAYLFHVTVTGLSRMWEPGVPDPDEIIGAIYELSAKLGSHRVIWRFDPIILTASAGTQEVAERFSYLTSRLRGLVDRVVISFVRSYPRVTSRLRRQVVSLDMPLPSEEVARALPELATHMAAAAASAGITIVSCADNLGLHDYGILRGSCIDPDLVGRISGRKTGRSKDTGQRAECGCARSIDIGIYGTCRHSCLYCYASTDSRLGKGFHNPCSSFLID